MCRALLRVGERHLKHHLEAERGGRIEMKQVACKDLPMDDASSLTTDGVHDSLQRARLL